MCRNRSFFRSYRDLIHRQKSVGWIKKAVGIAMLFMTLMASTQAWAASVTLAWDPNDPGPEGYLLFIRLSGEYYNYNTPALVASTSSCRVEGLVPGTTYFMIVRAYEGSLQSGDSNEISYTPEVSGIQMSQSVQASEGSSSGRSVNTDADTGPAGDLPGVRNLTLKSVFHSGN